MKKVFYSAKRDSCVHRNWIEPKVQLAILALAALIIGGCEATEYGSSQSSGGFAPPAAFGQPASAQGSGFAGGLDGRWYHDGNATSINVAPDGRNLTIINEQGRRNDGYATSPREIEIPSLSMRGHVSHSGNRISWTNGTEWTREPGQGGSHFGHGRAADLSGRWYHDGKPTSISVSGQSVTITNEVGQTSSGSMSGDDITIGELRGRVSHNGQRISWSNGTEWRR